jgi:2-desacetyl-2-hydroxyethyl bacteriochlorophyllide A dehydrogenase
MGCSRMVSTNVHRTLYFSAPGVIEIQEGELPSPGPEQVLVKTLLSGISAGTEMLIYRGQFPAGIPVDESIPALSDDFSYPLKYGYALVGKVIETGARIDPLWVGRHIFAFHSHESHFTSTLKELHPVPSGVSVEDAVFLANMETAVNLLQDSRPMIGERAVVFGQGIVGLLTTALLARFPLACLVTLDGYAMRRELSVELGANASLDPAFPDLQRQLKDLLQTEADLVFEISGNPDVLNQAIDITGYSGRIVIASWYGKKRAEIDLGGRFHRNRIHLIGSQVSSLDPSLTGRWDKARRLQVAWGALASIRPSRFITQRFPIGEAAQAYQLLDQELEQSVQVVLDYPE